MLKLSARVCNDGGALPFDYQTLNYYNASRSPSTVHVKNTRLRKYFHKYLFQRAISVFKWEGFPESWDKDYFLYTLYGMGYIAVFNSGDKFGIIPQGGALGGYNVFYRPAYIIITNPLITGTKTLNINKDCTIIKLQPDYTSVMDIVGYYADMLALCAEASGINLVNVKTGTVFVANGKTSAESYKKAYDKLSDGDPAIVIDEKLVDPQGKPTWFSFSSDVKNNYIVSDVLSDMRKIVQMFDSDIGIPNSNTDKKERLIQDEVNANNVETYTLGELWLEHLKQGLTETNKMFNLNLSVDWRVKPEELKPAYEIEKEGAENE